MLNQQGHAPGEAARPGRQHVRFTARHVGYIVHQYNLRSRYDRLRERGMLTMQEAAMRLDIHEQTVARWAKFGLITSHAYNGHYCLYELPISELPQKHSSRWDRLEDRAAERATQTSQPNLSPEEARGVV